MSTIWTGLLAYLTSMWHEFVSYVHHQNKKGKTGFWHELQKSLIAIPLTGILVALAAISLVVLVMLLVPIVKMFGCDLGALFARKQAALQAKFKPAMWIPGFAKRHSDRQTWTSVNTAEAVYKDLLQSVKQTAGRKDTGGETSEVVESDNKKMWIKVHCFSKGKWLDVMEFNVKVGQDMGGTEVDAFSYSTGAAPLSLLPYIGLMTSLSLFWFPFSDGGLNKKRLEDVRSKLRTDVRVESNKSK